MSKKISLFSLVILIVAAIDNMKNLPAAALLGSDLIPFFALAALIFLLPTAFVSAELSASYPTQGGIYHWTGMAFGKKWAMAAIWLQWINTMVWYPTMLAFIAGTAAYLVDPALGGNKVYLVTTSLVIFWVMTWINLKGIRVSAVLNNVLALGGMVVPMLFLILLGTIWYFSGHPLQIDMKVGMPNLTQSTSWVSLIAILASFLGMELSSVHVNDINKPQRNFPRALLCASAFILFTMAGGALAIATILPQEEIDLVSGIMQLFTTIFHVFGLERWTPVMTCLIALGALGTMINWIISPAKGLLDAGEEGFLPHFFTKKNGHGVASRILIVQALLVTLISLFFLLEPNVNSYFWFLTALSTELYMLMYLLMFSAALVLRFKNQITGAFKIPGGIGGLGITCLLGMTGCLATIIVSFFPPTNIDMGLYLLKICVGNIITLTPLLLFYLFANRRESALNETE